MNSLEKAIQVKITRPMAYPEIEKAVRKQRKPFELGLTLVKMVRDGRLHYSVPDTFSAQWPVYSRKPIQKNFKHPKRDSLLPNVIGGMK